MTPKELLFIRAVFYVLLSVAVFAGSAILGKYTKESRAEKIFVNIVIGIVSAGLLFVGVTNMYYSQSPKLDTKIMVLDSLTYRLGFEALGSFSDKNEEYVLTIPIDVGKKNIENGRLVEGQAYMVTYDVRADVVFEITEHAQNKGGRRKTEDESSEKAFCGRPC